MWLRVRGLPWRPAAAVIATVSMMLAAVMGSHFAGMRAQAVEPVQTTTIPHTKITGDGNYFTFADNAWEPGNDVHAWSKVPSDSLPAEDIWYTVRFFGSAIDVYAGKNRPMGKVKYYIDGAEKGTYSLYNASNINETKIASFTGLDEGEHVFKAVATGERDTNSTNALIDCAKVVVTHQPYVVTGVTLDTTSMTLGVGDSKRISYTVAPDYATIDDMTYTSGDTSVATVGADGTVTAVAPGATAITVASTAAGISKTVDVTVARMAPNLTGGIVDPDTQYTQKRSTSEGPHDEQPGAESVEERQGQQRDLARRGRHHRLEPDGHRKRPDVAGRRRHRQKQRHGHVHQVHQGIQRQLSRLRRPEPRGARRHRDQPLRKQRHPLPKRPDHGEGQSGAEHLGIVRHTEGRQGRHLHHHADRHRRRDGNAAHIHLHHRGEGRYAA